MLSTNSYNNEVMRARKLVNTISSTPCTMSHSVEGLDTVRAFDPLAVEGAADTPKATGSFITPEGTLLRPVVEDPDGKVAVVSDINGEVNKANIRR